jgi:diamine N-acetyltransferase
MTGQISIRPMSSESAQRLGPELANIDPWARYGYTSEALVKYLVAREEGAPRFEILLDDVLAGTISIRHNWLRGPYLQLFAVLPFFQKRGIGRHALEWFEGEARRVNAQNIWVVVSEFNLGARALYERFGFSQVGSFDSLIAEGTAEILFRKRLTIG